MRFTYKIHLPPSGTALLSRAAMTGYTFTATHPPRLLRTTWLLKIMMVFILMGGIFTPVESMPEWAQIANRVNPISYFMKIMRMIVLKGSGFFDLIEELISLLILGTIFLSLAIWRYRKTI